VEADGFRTKNTKGTKNPRSGMLAANPEKPKIRLYTLLGALCVLCANQLTAFVAMPRFTLSTGEGKKRFDKLSPNGFGGWRAPRVDRFSECGMGATLFHVEHIAALWIGASTSS
jgi:hypothetical protein